MGKKKKFSSPEIILIVLLVLTAYLFGVFADLLETIPVVGQIAQGFDWIYNFIILVVVQGWFIFKGDIGFKKQATVFSGNLVEFVPFLNIIPIDIITTFVAIYLVNKEAETEEKGDFDIGEAAEVPA